MASVLLGFHVRKTPAGDLPGEDIEMMRLNADSQSPPSKNFSSFQQTSFRQLMIGQIKSCFLNFKVAQFIDIPMFQNQLWSTY